MSVFWQINLEHQPADTQTITRCAFNIIRDYLTCNGCRPRTIYLANNGIGASVGEILEFEGLPVKMLGPAHWRQAVDPTADGPTQEPETCL